MIVLTSFLTLSILHLIIPHLSQDQIINLIIYPSCFQPFFSVYKKKSAQKHYKSMPTVTEHDSENEWKCDHCVRSCKLVLSCNFSQLLSSTKFILSKKFNESIFEMKKPTKKICFLVISVSNVLNSNNHSFC